MKMSDIVRQIVAAQGDTQEHLAKELGVTQPSVSRWMKGSEPQGHRRDEIRAIAIRLGIIDQSPGAGATRTAQRDRRGVISVPLISWVSAGRLTEVGAPIPVQDVPKFEISGLPSGEYFGLKVHGTSMDRLSPEHSIIIINKRERTPVEGKPFIFCIKGETTYKLWYQNPPRLEPFSTEPSNKPIFLDRRQKVIVIGRVRRTILDL